MIQALEKKDFAAIQWIGDMLRGHGGTIGFHFITEIGKAIETAAQDKDELEITRCIFNLSHYLENVEVIYY
jgi:hypothetical protein